MSKYNIIIEQSKSLDNINSLSSDNTEDEAIITLEKEAKEYLLSHNWCDEILDGWLAVSFEDILCIFLYHIRSSNINVDEYVWMVVGDIPPAYIDIESADNAKNVLKEYVDLMSDWVSCVENGDSIDECYPVEVEPSKKCAKMLKDRLNFILTEILDQI